MVKSLSALPLDKQSLTVDANENIKQAVSFNNSESAFEPLSDDLSPENSNEIKKILIKPPSNNLFLETRKILTKRPINIHSIPY
ncbi:unnamed protein product [Candida verbasci]|uniref:Uncharacterized protein n=1 Tax=Candida verbasci TaxID=1227364 RepID=A0A9W4XA21_9ASCO|nr:unnamed protein product [Candida verbasci]